MNRDPVKLAAWRARSKPLRSTTALVSATPINARSTKGKQQDRERAKTVADIRRKAGGYVICARCGQREGTDPHEPGKRSQGADPTDAAAIVMLCRLCHSWAHEHPKDAAAEGWLHSRKYEVHDHGIPD